MTRLRWSLLVTVVFCVAVVASLTIGLWLDDNLWEAKWPGAVDMMRILPADVDDFNYEDVSMRPARWWEYSEWREHFGDDFLGQSWENAHSMTVCDRRNIWLWSGAFDLDSIAEFLGSDYGEYRGVKVWQDQHYSMAILNDIVIIAYDDDVRCCIDVAKRAESSLYDDESYRGVLNRLPKAVSVAVWAPDYLPGVLAMGKVRVEGDGTYTETTVYRYGDADSAKDRVDEIEAGLEKARREGELNENLIDFEVVQDSEYVTITSVASS